MHSPHGRVKNGAWCRVSGSIDPDAALSPALGTCPPSLLTPGWILGSTVRGQEVKPHHALQKGCVSVLRGTATAAAKGGGCTLQLDIRSASTPHLYMHPYPSIHPFICPSMHSSSSILHPTPRCIVIDMYIVALSSAATTAASANNNNKSVHSFCT